MGGGAKRFHPLKGGHNIVYPVLKGGGCKKVSAFQKKGGGGAKSFTLSRGGGGGRKKLRALDFPIL